LADLLGEKNTVRWLKITAYKPSEQGVTNIIVELLCPCDKPIDLLSVIKGLKYFHQIHSWLRSSISK